MCLSSSEVDQSDLDPDQKEPDPDQKEPDPDQKDPDPREPDTRGPDHVSQLPPETLLRLLGYLGPADLCRCSQVCRRWAALTRTGTLWRHLYPVRWATGKTGPRLAPDWPRTGPRLDPDWPQTGPRLDPDWPQTGPRLVPDWSQTGTS